MPYDRPSEKPDRNFTGRINDHIAQVFENEGAVMKTGRVGWRFFLGTHRVSPGHTRTNTRSGS